MAQFKYIAIDASGNKIGGSVDAPSEAEARFALRAQQLRPLKLDQASVLQFDLAKLFGSGVSDDDVLWFTRQISILISSGVPLLQSLEIISNQIKSDAFRTVILSIREKVTGGSFLWEAMKSQVGVFPAIYISMIRAGESAGAMDAVLKRLNKYLEDAKKLKSMFKTALIYPSAVVFVGSGVMAIMLVFVIPKFEELLANSGQTLPTLTQWVVYSSRFAVKYFALFVAAFVIGGYLLVRYLKTDEGRAFFDHYILRVPVLGDIVLKIALSRFSRTMQTMLASGIPLLDAMDITRDALGNKTISDQILHVRSEVEQGKTMSAVMTRIPYFPSMLIQMIAVGENTGNLDKMLEKVSDFYDEEVSNAIGAMTKLIEPLVLVVLGTLVGGILVAMYLPIFDMAGSAI